MSEAAQLGEIMEVIPVGTKLEAESAPTKKKQDFRAKSVSVPE